MAVPHWHADLLLEFLRQLKWMNSDFISKTAKVSLISNAAQRAAGNQAELREEIRKCNRLPVNARKNAAGTRARNAENARAHRLLANPSWVAQCS